MIKFSNNASATLASGIAAGATSVSVTVGQGALFPSLIGTDFCMATLVDGNNNLEIVKVTARTEDTLTIVRAQEGTAARAWAAADRIEVRATAGGLATIQSEATTAASAATNNALAFAIAL